MKKNSKPKAKKGVDLNEEEAPPESQRPKKTPRGVTHKTTIDWDKFRLIGGAYPLPAPIDLANIATKFVLAGDQPYDAVRRAMMVLEESACLIHELNCVGQDWVKKQVHYTFNAGLKEAFETTRPGRAAGYLQDLLFESAKTNASLPDDAAKKAWVYEKLKDWEENGFSQDMISLIKQKIRQSGKKYL